MCSSRTMPHVQSLSLLSLNSCSESESNNGALIVPQTLVTLETLEKGSFQFIVLCNTQEDIAEGGWNRC